MISDAALDAEYCHGHTPVIPNPSLDLLPAQPRVPVSRPVLAHRVARVNLNRTQATALATNLIRALENNQDSNEVLCHGSDGKVPDSAVMTTRAGSILVMDYS
jgi:hypothetical protein